MIRDPSKSSVYTRLAADLKHKIAVGEFPPGSRIPSDLSISQTYGVAIMTVRNALRLLMQDGLLKRVQGSGTYVCGPDMTNASFNLDGLMEKLNDKANIDIRILDADSIAATPQAARALNLEPDEMILYILRLVSYQGRPFLLNKAYLIADPRLPIVESELETSSLFGLFSGRGDVFIRKVLLKIEPHLLSRFEAAHIQTALTMPAFKIRYTFFAQKDHPMGTGWFLTSKANLTLSSKIGVWEDDDALEPGY
ncbi:hypothetical protein FACS189460_3550 [Deltaproteobacteria bacterium]|nr:hypothetical protein FACS189460_3550 [Deltaproteobacteria bacterium]